MLRNTDNKMWCTHNRSPALDSENLLVYRHFQQIYTFKPFVFKLHVRQSRDRPKARSGHRIVCDDGNLYSYGGFNPYVLDSDPAMRNDLTWNSSKPLFKELWKFNFVTQQWKRLPYRENMPNELASNAVILKGNILIVYGGTGVPFGDSCSNQLYICDVQNGKMKMVPAKGDLPIPQYGQALICEGYYLYTIGGTTGYDYTCDIHRFDLRTGTWEAVYICTGRDLSEPRGRYRHEVASDGRYIYVLGGGTANEAFGFSNIPAFDLKRCRWLSLKTHGDKLDDAVPAARRCHGCVQYTNERTGEISVVISGGYNDDHVYSDVWRLDLGSLRWTCLRKCSLPNPVYFHSAALTPEGHMFTFGGIIEVRSTVTRTNAVHSVWLTIPKLTEICWQALNYYVDLKQTKPSELLRLGIPLKFVERIDY